MIDDGLDDDHPLWSLRSTWLEVLTVSLAAVFVACLGCLFPRLARSLWRTP